MVNDASATPRIEIELTAHEGKTKRRERKRPVPASIGAPVSDAAALAPSIDRGQPSGERDGPVGSERRRLVITALAVGAIALFLGWVLGRAGGDGSAAQTIDGTATTVADERTNDGPIPSLVGSGTLPEAELPTTSRPRPTTTTSVPAAWEVTQYEVDPRLKGTSDSIVALGEDNRLIEFDLTTGLTTTAPPPRSRMASTFPPIAGDDWIMMQFDDGRGPSVFRDGAAVGTELRLGSSWSNVLLWQIDTDLFWTVEFDFDDNGLSLVEYGIDGGPTGRTIDTNDLWPSVADPAGGLIVTDAAGSYTVTPEGSQRLPDGRLVAAGVGHLLLYSCGATLADCGLRVVDRATGEERSVPMPAPPFDHVDRLSGWWSQTMSRPMISPDGAAALLAVSSVDEQMVAVLDLTTGELEPFAESGGTSTEPFTYPSAVWSGDGRFAYLVADSVLTAYDRTTGESFPVVPGDVFPDVRSLTIRPPTPA